MLEEPLIPCTNTQTTGMHEAFSYPLFVSSAGIMGPVTIQNKKTLLAN